MTHSTQHEGNSCEFKGPQLCRDAIRRCGVVESARDGAAICHQPRRLIGLGPLDAKMPKFAIGVGAACAGEAEVAPPNGRASRMGNRRPIGAGGALAHCALSGRPWVGCVFRSLACVVSPLRAWRIEARLKGAVASAQRAARAFPLRLGSDWLSYGIGRTAGRRETRARRSQAAPTRLEFMGRGGHGAGRIRQFGELGPMRQIRRGGLRVSWLFASTSDSRKTRAPTRRSRRRKIRKK